MLRRVPVADALGERGRSAVGVMDDKLLVGLVPFDCGGHEVELRVLPGRQRDGLAVRLNHVARAGGSDLEVDSACLERPQVVVLSGEVGDEKLVRIARDQRTEDVGGRIGRIAAIQIVALVECSLRARQRLQKTNQQKH